MAMTAAERQRRYRERARERCEWINTPVTAHAGYALERLARHHGLPRRQVLERLLAEAEAAVVDELAGEERRGYYRP